MSAGSACVSENIKYSGGFTFWWEINAKGSHTTEIKFCVKATSWTVISLYYKFTKWKINQIVLKSYSTLNARLEHMRNLSYFMLTVTYNIYSLRFFAFLSFYVVRFYLFSLPVYFTYAVLYKL